MPSQQGFYGYGLVHGNYIYYNSHGQVCWSICLLTEMQKLYGVIYCTVMTRVFFYSWIYYEKMSRFIMLQRKYWEIDPSFTDIRNVKKSWGWNTSLFDFHVIFPWLFISLIVLKTLTMKFPQNPFWNSQICTFFPKSTTKINLCISSRSVIGWRHSFPFVLLPFSEK